MNEKKLSIGSNLLWGQVGRTYGCSDCTIIQHLDTQCWDTRLGQRIYLLHTLTTYNEAFLSISVIGVFCQNLIEWQHNKSCSNSQMTCISTTLSSSTWTSEDNQFNFVGIHGKTCTWIHIFISKLILLENFFCPQWNLMCHQHTQYSILNTINSLLFGIMERPLEYTAKLILHMISFWFLSMKPDVSSAYSKFFF